MKFLFFFLILLSINLLNAQSEYLNQLIDNSIYSKAQEHIKKQKPFIREWQFFEERAFPSNFIPANAYQNAVQQRNKMRGNNFYSKSINWISIGPTPGAYSNWGSISSRIVTGAYNPTNPNIIYIGPANGGVWKSTDNGLNWKPLTDNQPSLSMGAITIDPINSNIIYAGTGEATYSGSSYYGLGLLKSTDAGESWIHTTSGLPSFSYFSRIIIRPNKSNELLSALGNNGLYRSTDFGITWSSIVSGRVDDCFFSISGDTAYAVGSGIGLQRSLNGGINFSAYGSDLQNGSRTHFDFCRNEPNVFYAAVYSGSNVNVFKSTNYGLNFSQCAVGTNFSGSQAWYDLYCRVHPKNSNIAFVGTIEIFRTTDGGASFSNISLGYSGGNVHVDQHYLFFHPSNDNTFIVTNDGGIWRTSDNGNSFENLNAKLTLTQFYRITASPFSPARILGGTQDNGTQQTYGSINWASAFGGDGGEVCFNPFDQNYILGESQNGGLVKTTNGGSSWSNATNGINTSESVAWVAPIIAHPKISGIFYVARSRIYRTMDNGISWTPISGNVNGTSAVREMAISNSNENVLLASVGSQIFISADGGANWSNISSGLPSKTITSVYVHPDSSNILFVTFSGFGGYKVYRTTNYGVSWQSINSNLPDSPVNDILILPEDANNTYFVANDVGVFITRNAGASWEELYQGLPNTVIKHLDYSRTTKKLRAGTHGRGVYEALIDFLIPVELISFNYKTFNNSVILDWQTATETNNKGFEIYKSEGKRQLLEVNNENIKWINIGFVKGNGTTIGKSIYHFVDPSLQDGKYFYKLIQVDFDGTKKEIGIISCDISNPIKFSLEQNYPNPFNPKSNIKYQIANRDFVSLKVFDVLGKEIATLVNEVQDKGEYEVEFSANNRKLKMQYLPSGIYLAKLKVGDFTKTIKMVLNK